MSDRPDLRAVVAERVRFLVREDLGLAAADGDLDGIHPEQSTDAMIVHHPEAKYFNAS